MRPHRAADRFWPVRVVACAPAAGVQGVIDDCDRPPPIWPCAPAATRMPAYSFRDNLVFIKPAAAQRPPSYADGLLATKACHDDHLGNIVLMIIVIPSGFTSRIFRFPTRLPCWTLALAFPFPDFTPPAGGVSPTLAF